MGRLGEFVDEGSGGGEADAAPLSAGFHAQARGEMRFACAGLADQQHGFGPGDVIASGQLPDLGGRNAGTVELEAVQGLHPWQSRLVEQPRDGTAVALLHLG